MAYLAKQRMFYYKKYKIDIWNVFKNTLQLKDDFTFYLNKKRIYGKRRKKIRKLHYLTRLNNDIKMQLNFKLNLINNDNKSIKAVKEKKNVKKLTKNLNLNERKKTRIITNILIHENLLTFMKCTVSKKSSILFNTFIGENVFYQKIFYKKPFLYEVKIPRKRKKRRKANVQFVSFRFMKLFYIMYNYRQIKRMVRKAKLQNGVFEQNFLLMVECKLPQYLYRVSFFPTIFDSLEFVKTGNVWVNKKFKPLINYSIKLFDIVGFRVFYKSYIYWSFYKRLKRKAFAFMLSRCIFVSFHFLFTVLIARFKLDDLVNSFKFDYYRIAAYAQ